MKIYFITRTVPEGSDGGAIVRKGTIQYLRNNGFDVWVVAPVYNKRSIIIDTEKQFILIPYNLSMYHFNRVMESLGVFDDYLVPWVNRSYKELVSLIMPDDLIFTTSGGEMGCLLLGVRLKEKIGCKLIHNLHDPIDSVKLVGELAYKSKLPHIDRAFVAKRCLLSADAIITSTNAYKEKLLVEFNDLEGKVFCNYFGYLEPASKVNSRKAEDVLHIVYGGAMGRFQSPEILAQACANISGVKATFVGDYHLNSDLMAYKGKVELLPKMAYEVFMSYLKNEADVGFLSLVDNISNYCVPSKLYEYINIGLPILAVINGDTKEIVNSNNLGVVCDNTRESITKGIKKMQDTSCLLSCKQSVLSQRYQWSMEYKIHEVIEIIDNVLSNRRIK